jgi:hypothetical protein
VFSHSISATFVGFATSIEVSQKTHIEVSQRAYSTISLKLNLWLSPIELSKTLSNPYITTNWYCSSSNLAQIVLPNMIVILRMMRENRQTEYTLADLPFHWHQQPLSTWPPPPTTALMAIEFGYAIGVTEKMVHTIILTTIVKSPLSNKKWQ